MERTRERILRAARAQSVDLPYDDVRLVDVAADARIAAAVRKLLDDPSYRRAARR